MSKKSIRFFNDREARAVMAAVNNGTITEERINQSVRRILRLRLGMNR